VQARRVVGDGVSARKELAHSPSQPAALTRQRLRRQLPQPALPVARLGAQQVPGQRLKVRGEGGDVGGHRQVGLGEEWRGCECAHASWCVEEGPEVVQVGDAGPVHLDPAQRVAPEASGIPAEPAAVALAAAGPTCWRTLTAK
jgi:hypothetical protein